MPRKIDIDLICESLETRKMVDRAKGRLMEGGLADLCIFDPHDAWTVQPGALHSQGKHTPFSGYELPGRVRCTVIGAQVGFANFHVKA